MNNEEFFKEFETQVENFFNEEDKTGIGYIPKLYLEQLRSKRL